MIMTSLKMSGIIQENGSSYHPKQNHIRAELEAKSELTSEEQSILEEEKSIEERDRRFHNVILTPEQQGWDFAFKFCQEIILII